MRARLSDIRVLARRRCCRRAAWSRATRRSWSRSCQTAAATEEVSFTPRVHVSSVAAVSAALGLMLGAEDSPRIPRRGESPTPPARVRGSSAPVEQAEPTRGFVEPRRQPGGEGGRWLERRPRPEDAGHEALLGQRGTALRAVIQVRVEVRAVGRGQGVRSARIGKPDESPLALGAGSLHRLSQLLLQPLTSAEDSRFHRPHRRAGHVRDRPVVQPLHVAKRDCQAEVLGQRRQSAVDGVAISTRRSRSSGSAADSIGSSGSSDAGTGHEEPAPPRYASAMRLDHVDRHPIQPGLEAALTAERGQPAPRPHEYVLREILGIPAAAGHHPREIQDRRLIPPDQLVECLAAAGGGGVHERAVGIHSAMILGARARCQIGLRADPVSSRTRKEFVREYSSTPGGPSLHRRTHP